jgi:eukaryotic-like serine/threonine-protein kinase
MEFLQGPSLGARLREREKLPVEETARLGAGLLAALRHAHGAGVVHRDLKPDNIMITETRTVITDFGIARPFDGTTALTMPSAIVGTPAFMAPEQIEGKKVTAASDLWSLGVTLYVAVEGALPFNGQTLGELCAAVLTRPMPAPRNAGALTPLLRALLAKDPSARPTTDAAIRLLAAADCSAASATWAQGRSGAVTAGPPSARTLPDRAAPLTEAMGVQPVRGRYVNFCLFSGHSMVWACP